MDRVTSKLAMRSEYLPFALPDISPAAVEHVTESLLSGWITTGPKVRQFEAAFAARVGARHAIAVNSCTAAMHLALEAIGLQADDEVITTPYTFAATAEVIRYFGAKPVLVDVLPETFNIDPAGLPAAITPRTRAIIPVHIAGLAADMDEILAIARAHNLVVITDAAHAFPATYKEQTIGSIADFTCFSFYATKTITTGEGGMITTDNDEWAERCRIMALHGISKDAWKRYTAEGSWYYEIIAPGFKYNLTDIAAGIGLAQLERADEMWHKRAAIAHQYQQLLGEEPALTLPATLPDRQHAWHLYMLRLNLARLTIDRAQFIEEMKKRNIGTSVHFIPLHIHPYYREKYGFAPEAFPVAYREYQREISLPIFSKMSSADVYDVANAVLDIVQQHTTA